MLQLNNKESYISYFQSIADSHTEINDFHFGEVDIIQNNLKSDVIYPVLWLEPYAEIRVRDAKSDNFLGVRACSLTILGKPESESFEDIDSFEAFCENVIIDILSKLLRDFNNNDVLTDINGYIISRIRPTFSDHLFGAHLEFNYVSPLKLIYNSDKWNQI